MKRHKTQHDAQKKPKLEKDAKLSNLMQWLRSSNISWHQGIEIKRDSVGGFGVFATKELPAGVAICHIPKSAILSPKTSSLRSIIEEEGVMGGLAVTLCLMHEISLGKQSKWYNYIESMPQREDLPMFWEEKDLFLLDGTELDPETIKSENKLMLEDYESVIKPLLDKHRKKIATDWKDMNFELY